MKPAASILLADDHPFICDGLRTILEPQYVVVGMAHHGNDVVGMVERLKPDLVLLDLSLPGRGGLQLTRDLKARERPPRVVVVTMHSDRVYVDEAFHCGADGYLLKTARASELRKAISEALGGRRYTSPDLHAGQTSRSVESGQVSAGKWEGELAPLANLTPRQREVLLLVGQGYANHEIAERLHLSIKAIEYHRAGIRGALAINTQAGLYRFATLYAAEVAGAGHRSGPAHESAD